MDFQGVNAKKMENSKGVMVNLTENPGARGQLQRNRYPQQGKFFFWKSPLLQENCCHRKAE